MKENRARVAALATVLGLGALGGVALKSNPGMPPPSAQVGAGGSAGVVTAASGSGAPAGHVAVAERSAEARPPIVTRASGTGAAGAQPLDD